MHLSHSYKTIFSIFLFLISLIAVFLVVNYVFNIKQVELNSIENGVAKSLEDERDFRALFQKSRRQLLAIENNKLFIDYLQQKQDRADVENYFLGIANANETIMQIRYIDKTGMEKVRIERLKQHNMPFIDQTAILQDKSNRYYFEHSKTKPLMRVWFSKLDLNVEHNQLDIPYRATLRAILPLKSENRFNGILIINYFADVFLNKLVNTKQFDVDIFDQNGYVMVSNDANKSWSQYSGTKVTLKELFPAEYKKILFNHFYKNSSLVARHFDLPLENKLIVVYKPNEENMELSHHFSMIFFTLEIVVLILIAFFASAFLTRLLKELLSESKVVKQAEKRVARRNDIFRAVTKIQSLYIEPSSHDQEYLFEILLKELLLLSKSSYGYLVEFSSVGKSTTLQQVFALSEESLNTENSKIYFQEPYQSLSLKKELIIVNKMHDDKHLKEYFPKGHPEIKKFLYLPLIRANKVVGGIGLANRVKNYDMQLVNEFNPVVSASAQMIELFRNEKLNQINEEKVRLWSNVFTHADEAIIITDADVKIIDVNDAFSALMGYSKDEVLGRNPRFLKSGIQPKGFYEKHWTTLQEKGSWSGEIYDKHKDGSILALNVTISAIKDNEGVVQNYVGIYNDISYLKNKQEKLEKLAYYDPLTSLPNRLLFLDRMQMSMAHARREKHLMAVVFIDLDGFKDVNDNYGHDVGDKLLIEMSKKIQRELRDEDTLSRFGGDEFIAILTSLTKKEDALQVIQRISEVSCEYVVINSHEVQISSSIGVSFYPQEKDVGFDELLEQADKAMYEVKNGGKNGYKILK